MTRRPAAPLFSGWNCVARTFSLATAPTNVSSPYVPVATAQPCASSSPGTYGSAYECT
jgi:hypothetical protein